MGTTVAQQVDHSLTGTWLGSCRFSLWPPRFSSGFLPHPKGVQVKLIGHCKLLPGDRWNLGGVNENMRTKPGINGQLKERLNPVGWWVCFCVGSLWLKMKYWSTDFPPTKQNDSDFFRSEVVTLHLISQWKDSNVSSANTHPFPHMVSLLLRLEPTTISLGEGVCCFLLCILFSHPSLQSRSKQADIHTHGRIPIRCHSLNKYLICPLVVVGDEV